MAHNDEIKKAFLEALIFATTEGRIAFEWRVEPALGSSLLAAADDEEEWLIIGPSGAAKLFGLPVISDPEVDGFLLLTA